MEVQLGTNESALSATLTPLIQDEQSERDRMGVPHSLRAISLDCGLPERWLDHVLKGAKGYEQPPVRRLLQLANGLRLVPDERRSVACAAGLSPDELLPPTPSFLHKPEKGGWSLGRAVILVRAPFRTVEVARTLAAAAGRFKGARISIARVFGPHDNILRVTSSRDTPIALTFVDTVQREWPSTAPRFHSTETILLRDDLDFVESDSNVTSDKALSDAGYIRAFVFVTARQAFSRLELLRTAYTAASSDRFGGSGLALIQAAATIGRFDVFLDVAVYGRRLDVLQVFLEQLYTEQGYGDLETLTYISFPSR